MTTKLNIQVGAFILLQDPIKHGIVTFITCMCVNWKCLFSMWTLGSNLTMKVTSILGLNLKVQHI